MPETFAASSPAEYDSCATAVLEPPRGHTCLTACESGSSDADSPWLPRPRRPHGAGRTEREHVLDASFRPSAEQLAKARKWLVRALACRAVEILKAKDRRT